MNYIEELNIGDTFILDNNYYIVTTDFNKKGSKLCVNLKNGSTKWMDPSYIIKKTPVYIIDNDNNIAPLKKEEDIINVSNIKIS